MKNLFALVGFAVVGFAGVGWYCGWFAVAVQPGTDGKKRIAVDVDTRKIADDTQRAGQQVGRFIQDHAPTPSTAPAPTAAHPTGFVGPPAPPDVPAPKVGGQLHVGSKTITFGSDR